MYKAYERYVMLWYGQVKSASIVRISWSSNAM